jgi:hypothetical protein
LGFLIPPANEKLMGTTEAAAATAAVPINLRLEIVGLFIFIDFNKIK